jgi:peptide-methionine (R)-S-oxide reductase
MLDRRTLLTGAAGAALLGVASFRGGRAMAKSEDAEIVRTDAEWRKLLAPERYEILRQHGTEPPGSSPLNHEKRKGTFACAGCDLPLYSSATKFESGTGWPSFWQPLPNAIGTSVDKSLFMTRTEVHCRRCQGHLGHVFEDGPKPTGLRYCMNGLALTFNPETPGAT